MSRITNRTTVLLSVLITAVVIAAGTGIHIYNMYYRYPQTEVEYRTQVLRTSDSAYEIHITILRTSIVPSFAQYIKAEVVRPVFIPEKNLTEYHNKKVLYFAKQSLPPVSQDVPELSRVEELPYWADDLRGIKTDAKLIDDTILEIEGIRLNIFTDTFDFRRHRRERFID